MPSVPTDAEYPAAAAPAPPTFIARIGRPSPVGVARLIAIVAACVGALYLLYEVRAVVRNCVIALFVAIALAPVVDAVQRVGLRRAWAITVVYLGCALAVVGVTAMLVPTAVSQVGRLARDAEHAVAELRDSAVVRRYDDRYHITAEVERQLSALPSRVGSAVGPLQDVTIGTVRVISDLITILSIAFLLILHGDRYASSAIGVLSPQRASRWRRVGPQIYRAVSGYVLGNLAISVIAGTGAWIVMTALGIPFALPLALLVAFMDLIPMVGATLAAIVVALAALLVSPLTAGLWLVFSVVYQQAETYVIAPVVYRRSVQVSPLATIVAVLVGASLLGVLGALLAIPAAAALQLLVADLREHPQPAPGAASAPAGAGDGRRLVPS